MPSGRNMKKKNQDTTQDENPSSSTPNGFTMGVTPDGKEYLVPQYIVPALDQAFSAYQTKAQLGVSNAQPGSSQSGNKPYVLIGDALYFPADPQLSEQETLSLHAEVLALQETLGISYKDASHRLYMAEMEKIKVADEKFKAFKNVERRIECYLEKLSTRLQPQGSSNNAANANAANTDTANNNATNADADADTLNS
ncbi:hypothetical protein M413DRAFT_14730 [Hebeloma cylindrosporum]|uniref:Uncharacterized protein n=1 Tax=Hebeloma cylindrosporum TaxID=76867 RepID=A0A0C2Y1Z6_HEBCY|nr:hypothetical protein M413DRAFT_14730 [Hebeloma cylindrosporum h7]